MNEDERHARPARDDFGSRLKTCRLACGITQAALATSTGMSTSYLCQIETGVRTPPSLGITRQLAVNLNCSAVFLLEGTLKPAPSPAWEQAVFYDHLETFWAAATANNKPPPGLFPDDAKRFVVEIWIKGNPEVMTLACLLFPDTSEETNHDTDA